MLQTCFIDSHWQPFIIMRYIEALATHILSGNLKYLKITLLSLSEVKLNKIVLKLLLSVNICWIYFEDFLKQLNQAVKSDTSCLVLKLGNMHSTL